MIDWIVNIPHLELLIDALIGLGVLAAGFALFCLAGVILDIMRGE